MHVRRQLPFAAARCRQRGQAKDAAAATARLAQSAKRPENVIVIRLRCSPLAVFGEMLHCRRPASPEGQWETPDARNPVVKAQTDGEYVFKKKTMIAKSPVRHSFKCNYTPHELKLTITVLSLRVMYK